MSPFHDTRRHAATFRPVAMNPLAAAPRLRCRGRVPLRLGAPSVETHSDPRHALQVPKTSGRRGVSLFRVFTGPPSSNGYRLRDRQKMGGNELSDKDLQAHESDLSTPCPPPGSPEAADSAPVPAPVAEPVPEPVAPAPGEPPTVSVSDDVNRSPTISDPGKTASRRYRGLLQGNSAMVTARRDKATREQERQARDEATKRDRLAAVATREGVLAALRDILADPDESGAYRTAAARLLLMPEAETPCARPCCARREPPPSVRAWLAAGPYEYLENPLRRQEYEAEGRCLQCSGLLTEPAAPRSCAALHKVPEGDQADEVKR